MFEISTIIGSRETRAEARCILSLRKNLVRYEARRDDNSEYRLQESIRTLVVHFQDRPLFLRPRFGQDPTVEQQNYYQIIRRTVDVLSTSELIVELIPLVPIVMERDETIEILRAAAENFPSRLIRSEHLLFLKTFLGPDEVDEIMFLACSRSNDASVLYMQGHLDDYLQLDKAKKIVVALAAKYPYHFIYNFYNFRHLMQDDTTVLGIIQAVENDIGTYFFDERLILNLSAFLEAFEHLGAGLAAVETRVRGYFVDRLKTSENFGTLSALSRNLLETSFTSAPLSTLALVYRLFSYKNTDTIYDASLFLSLTPDATISRVASFLPNQVLTEMAQRIDIFRFQVAFVLCETGYSQIPDELAALLKLRYHPNELMAIPFNNNWNLCPAGEKRLSQSLKRKAVTVINDNLVLKYIGKLTGLCIRSFSTDKGTFIEGCFYSPVGNIRAQIRLGFDGGQGRIHLSEGSFALMRVAD